jgi:putative ABC transport system ATP-binding protein
MSTPREPKGGGERGVMVEVRDITRTFGSGQNATAALRGVSFSIGEGQLVALRGRSDSGKTTLLNVVGGLDSPDGGTVRVAGHEVTGMDGRLRMRLRRETVAYIFQSFGLLPVLSAAENVGVPLRIAGVPSREREERVALMLSLVGLAERTGQLDQETGKQIMRLLRAVVRSEGVTALVATHDAALMDLADDILQLEDGTIIK